MKAQAALLVLLFGIVLGEPAAYDASYYPRGRATYDNYNHRQRTSSRLTRPSNQYVPAVPSSSYLPPDNDLVDTRTSAFPSTSYGVPDYSNSAASSYVEQRPADRVKSADYSAHKTAHAYEYSASNDGDDAHYEFKYAVKDNIGNDYGHKESRDGKLTRGWYSVLLPDGRRQIVEYEADEHGYRPKISYEDATAQRGAYPART